MLLLVELARNLQAWWRGSSKYAPSKPKVKDRWKIFLKVYSLNHSAVHNELPGRVLHSSTLFKEKKMPANVQKNNVENARDFMLAEYSLLKDLRASVLQQTDRRLNFHFTSVSGVIAALALMRQFIEQNDLFLLVSVVLLFILFLMGIMTYDRMIQGHISITRYTRSINLIRRYFVSQHKNIGGYISNPISGDEPKFGNIGFVSGGKAPKINKIGLTAMTMLLNSFVVSMILLVVVQFIFQTNFVVNVLVGLVSFGISLAVHDTYLRKTMRKAEEAYKEDQEKLLETIKEL
jgi:hypothetical protein